MKLPNWLKVLWWALLLAGLLWFLGRRYPALVSGQGTAFDIVAFLLCLALLLAPIFSEVKLFGLELKQDISRLKDELLQLRLDVRNSVDVRTQISPTFQIPAPPRTLSCRRLRSGFDEH
jgi:hypothetical protein